MLKKIYIDNYRCFSNFEIDFSDITLLLGINGSGKTSIIDVLYGIRRLIIDKSTLNDVFSPEDLTCWVKSDKQVFELTVEGNGGLYIYRLVIDYQLTTGKHRISQEKLTFNGNLLFSFDLGEVHLYKDTFQEGPVLTFDWTQSGLSMVAPRSDNTILTWFKNWVDMLFIINLQPRAIGSVSDSESYFLNRDGTNFVSWYRYFSQEHQDKLFDLVQYLRQSIDGFDNLKLEAAGKHRVLKVGYKNPGKGETAHYFDFDRLSDGQRSLLILYIILFGLKELGHVLILDEPENFVALPEIQPWLMNMCDSIGEGIPQIILTSHHPELIDFFGADRAQFIDREPMGPSRVRKMPRHFPDGIKLSEVIARGWINE